jgi:hypothetical protein
VSTEYRIGRRAGNRSWSFVLFEFYDKKKKKFRPNTFKPRAQLTPKDSKAAFVRLAGGEEGQPFKAGRFLDAKTLAWALRNKHLSLENACREFGVAGKLAHIATGKVSNVEIDYCREDVAATVRLVNALRVEFDRYPIDLLPDKAFSAASIAKAFLSTMGVVPPAQKFEMSEYAKGICMQAYYGGRAEILIRHTAVPVVYTDFVSQYPTVNTLLGMSDLLTAAALEERDVTDEVHKLLKEITLEKLYDHRLWPKLAFFGLVEPDADILPVRTTYGDAVNAQSTNIGVNPLTSTKPIWFAGPDIVASYLLTGKVPKVIKALKFVPLGKQKNMKSVTLGEMSINPYKDIFFRKVIEERKRQKKNDSIQYFLKILANAGCYGIYAEVNRQRFSKNNSKELTIYSGEFQMTERSCEIEQAGSWYFPPMAALTTSGGRLLLAMLEKEVTNRGGNYLMCDTNSMAIVANEHGGAVECIGGPITLENGQTGIYALSWKEVGEVVSKFAALNPYDKEIIPGSILKIEDVNFEADGSRRQCFGYAISAKRYDLFVMTAQGPRVVKSSEHGLGLYYPPKQGRDSESNSPLWIKEAWQWIIDIALGGTPDAPEWFDLPVMRRIAISTPNVMASLRRLDRDKARPYNFALSPVLVNLTGGLVTLLAPFETNSAKWRTMPFINVHDGTQYTLEPPTLPILPQTFEMILKQYTLHPEAKSLAPDGTPSGPYTRGLLKRYPVVASGFKYIGKETERGWENAEDISTLLPQLKRYSDLEGIPSEQFRERLKGIPLAELERETGLSRHSIVRARTGKRVHPRTLKVLMRSVKVRDERNN